MIRIIRHWLVAGAGALLLAGCVSTPNTFSQADPGADFTRIKTYDEAVAAIFVNYPIEPAYKVER